MNHHWNLIPGKGIQKIDMEIQLGASQASVRSTLAAAFGEPVSHYENEEDFENASADTLIRVRYGNNSVKDIEFLRGFLFFGDIRLYGDTTWPEIESALGALGHHHRDTEWLGDGYDVPALGINIATHDQVGGDGDGIEWVILSVDFLNV